MSIKPILACKHLKKNFQEGILKVEVLKNINFSLQPGEMLAITGTSGSGKSTLLHLLGGLDQPTEGHVELMGENITHFSEKKLSAFRNRYLGFVYQFHHLLSEFTVLENVCMPLLIQGNDHSISDIQDQAYQMLARVKIKHRALHKIGEISGGERQRAAIARALITKPTCVLADEPTGNLDQKTAHLVFDLLMSLNQEFQISFIMVTHDLNLANQLNRQLVLREGVIESDS